MFLYGSSLLQQLKRQHSLDTIGLALQTSTTSPPWPWCLSGHRGLQDRSRTFPPMDARRIRGFTTPVVAFLSVGSKAAGFALALRILVGCFGLDGQWKLLFTVLAVLSMTLGNVVALAQTSMKRMLAYARSARPVS